jgi:hypothetical protein
MTQQDNIIVWRCQHQGCGKRAIYRPGMNQPFCREHLVQLLKLNIKGEEGK